MINKIFQWIKRGPFYFMTMIILVVFIFLIFFPNDMLRRIISNLFTIVGAIFVIIQLESDFRRLKPHSPENFSTWFLSLFRRVINIEVESTSLVIKTDSPLLSQRLPINPDDSLEVKVEKIIKNLTYINMDLNQHQMIHKDIRDEYLREIKKINSEISTSLEKIDNLVKDHIVGSYQMAFFGIITTICGALLSFLHYFPFLN